MTIERIGAGFSFHFEDDKGKKKKPEKPQKPVQEEPPLHPSVKKTDYPIVGDAGFSVPWMVTRQSPGAALRWMKEHWHYFNKKRFQGQLQEPHFRLAKNIDITKLRKRGDWNTSLNQLRLVPALFQAPDERYANHVLLHEMCHQYTAQILGEVKDSHAHGPHWQQTMIMIGMSPNRYEFTANKMFMNKVQQQDVLKREEILKNIKGVKNPVTYAVYGAVLGTKIVPAMFVGTIMREGERVHAVIVDPKDTKNFYTTASLIVYHNKKELYELSRDTQWLTRARDVLKTLKSNRELVK